MGFFTNSSLLSMMDLNDWNSSNWNEEEDVGNYGAGMLTFQIVAYVVLFLAGISGNLLVFVLFARRQTEKPFDVANHLVLSLAMADFGTLFFYIPFFLAYEMLGLVWPFGLVMCKFVFGFTHLCVYASLGSMVAIAVERYRVTFQLHVSKTMVVIGVVVVWGIAFILVIPQMLFLQLVEIDDMEEESPDRVVYACELIWPHPSYEKLVHPIDFTLFYLLPLMFICIIYVKVIYILRKAIKRNVLNYRLVKQSRKVIHVLALIVSIFALCVFPVHVLQLVRVFFYKFWVYLYIDYPWLFSVVAGIYLLTHVLNPIIYLLLHQKFREQAVEILRLTQVLGCSHTPTDHEMEMCTKNGHLIKD